MKDDKNTDRIIGRKLASYTAKPQRLTFNKVHENYLMRKKTGLHSTFIKASLVTMAAGIALVTYFLFPVSKNELSTRTKNNTVPTSGSLKSEEYTQQAFLSSQKTASDGPDQLSAHNKGKAGLDLPKKETSEHIQDKNERSSAPALNSSTLANLPEGRKKDTDLTEKNSNLVSGSTSGLNNTEEDINPEEVRLPSTFENRKKNNHSGKNKQPQDPAASFAAAENFLKETNRNLESVSKTTADHGVEEMATTEKGGEKEITGDPQVDASSGKGKEKVQIKPDSANPLLEKALSNPGNHEKSGREEKGTAHLPVQESLANTINEKTTPDGSVETELPTAASKPNNSPLKEENKEQLVATDTKAGEENKMPDSLSLVAKLNDSLIKINGPLAGAPANSANPSPSARKGYLMLSPELAWNSFSFKLGYNPAAGNDTISPVGKNAHTGPYRSFGGGLSLSYKYKNAGLSAGILFSSIESQVSTDAFARTQDIYSKQAKLTSRQTFTTIVTSTFVPSSDSTKPGTLITSVISLTGTATRSDTFDILSGQRSYVIVNGDTVSPQSYKNQIRFFTVPLYVNYSLNVWRNKLLIEPQAGIQIGIPLRSYQLVAAEDRRFIYSKTKYPLRDYFFAFDVNLKINYRLNRYMIIYYKQGYFFSSKSIYQNKYPVKNTLSNLYSSIGLSFPIR